MHKKHDFDTAKEYKQSVLLWGAFILSFSTVTSKKSTPNIYIDNKDDTTIISIAWHRR